ncbi:MAG: hypothetical protein RLZZ301_1348 [Bacteroidota bacterium]|jgi:4-hydroxy-tetrahydrodipicolinate reductase
MKIALIGYGKMGKAIEAIALERGHEICARVNRQCGLDQIDWSDIDVAIEFTQPELATSHIRFCLERNIPIVVGTTAWQHELLAIEAAVKQANGALLHASNFSVGVNLFFELNRQLAKLMNKHPEYHVRVEETHHVQKLDAPSGTAVSLLNDLIKEHDVYDSWQFNGQDNGQIPVLAHRIPDVPGTHEISYESDIDTIRIEHIAHNRKGFAQGAVIAAEFLVGKKGIFTMSDILNP